MQTFLIISDRTIKYSWRCTWKEASAPCPFREENWISLFATVRSGRIVLYRYMGHSFRLLFLPDGLIFKKFDLLP
jgi:hypothetical protein